ncbi:MAG: phosphoribosylformylglycinamidine synthase subunit PurL [Actinomycetota bacterium]|jgi:phosphoribosylformylglycinamidine synthase|nr:phosphoribosylformylglycinamidine synthase subunit PurL [Actinomycetota bacterium]MDA8281038.1 phosphoribosylformylglycinamidine synthase subunit PurL [Actinomycetota bacterium]
MEPVPSENPAGEALHRALGLTDDEAAQITAILGRPPTHVELAMYAVMWSEHCSYKSSRLHLRRLPTEAPQVLVGPGENAGVVDVGDGIAVAIRIESHNHPSAVEPYQGAATGVGGILRDIFTMGARPIALMDPLFFGDLDDPRTRWLVEGVVAGISGYGNSVGVPTVGGELTFAPGYARNPLVNVLCLGVLPVDRLVLGRASGAGNLAVLLGSLTGRDGIGGVSVLASAGFGAEAADDAKRPSVQVGDPFEEKRLIEACLELLDRHLVVGIQDLGGAGLACATSETAARGGMGMDVDVSAVPRREEGMAPFEVMTSESQERMLAIVAPTDLAAVQAVCERWEVRASVVGTVTEPGGAAGGSGATGAAGSGEAVTGATTMSAHPPAGRLRILDGPGGAVLADVPAASLSDDAPLYQRPLAPPADLQQRRASDPAALPAPSDCTSDLLAMLLDPAWAFRQYDHDLLLNTVVGPGGDAVVLRLAAPGLPPSGKGLALSTDSNPRWCSVDPRLGTELLVAESALNVACGGAHPVALVNCLNFGNPEHPEVMWQLSEAVDGMAAACRALGIPVVGGNVSLYNESGGADIDPTPVVAVLGVVDRLDRVPPSVALAEGGTIVALGPRTTGLAGSRWAVDRRGHRGGALTPWDADEHARLLGLVADLVGRDGLLQGVHDVADGGIAVALAECALRSGVGARVGGIDGHGELFSEAAGRVLVCTADPAEVESAAAGAGIGARVLGRAGGDRIVVDGLVDVTLAEATAAWRGALADHLDPSGDPAAS